ncbi:MAG TPA: hypothetical protein VNT79_00875 [Phycisphaerae bacterium]|nr:hypothetical protein [Phycisphaerae bacterium]
MFRRLISFMILFAVGAAAGCGGPENSFGRTWYIDGAGNLGYGTAGVPNGLKDKGYAGTVTNHRWSLTFNPALDQTLRFIAKGSGRGLGKDITKYLERNPQADANIIALSAGTGVAVWAVENMQPTHKINNLVLVGSSLSSKYDMRKALLNIKGKVYVYYASTDPVLDGPVRLLGTIDGTFDDSAGLVGLHGPGAGNGQVVNIGWTPRYRALGWTGGHADCVTRKFVAGEIAQRIVTPRSTEPGDREAVLLHDDALAARDHK